MTNAIINHPRRCGENGDGEKMIEKKVGSPPQVRGKHLNQQFLQHNHRITPAGAGKTFRARDIASCGRDHPRRCGENC